MDGTVAYICQGCGEMRATIGEMHERGFVNKRLYCAKCVKLVDEYLAVRDAIHTEVSKVWEEDLATAHFEFNHRGIKNLPDGG